MPRSREHDLRKEADIVRMLEAARPEIIIHLAAVVGGIGANRENPGRFFYDNLMMGAQLMEQARLHGATREFLYVEDAAEPIVLAAERYDGAEPVNLGAGQEISIRDLVGLIATITGFSGRIVWDASKPAGQPRRMLDTSRAATYFGFVAKTPFEEGLRKTIEWYRRSGEGKR